MSHASAPENDASRPVAVEGIDGRPERAASRSGDARPVQALLVRHAPTAWNDDQRRQGWADQPLTHAARRAAREWADDAPARFSRVVSSDLIRSCETAQIIAASLTVDDVEAMPGLREQHQGAWTGLTKEEIKRRWPERLRERPRRPVDGESGAAVLERVLATLGLIATEDRGRCVLIVTHSGVIRIVERAVGVDAPPVPHLEGRWFEVLAPSERHRSATSSWLVAGELTAGRRELAAQSTAADRALDRR